MALQLPKLSQGETMHVHGLNPNLLNLYSAVATEKTESAKRAAEVRKKLIAGAAELEGELEPEAIVEEAQEFPAPHQDLENPSPKKKQDANGSENNADDSPPEEPISIWG
jgi:hypothetical protein